MLERVLKNQERIGKQFKVHRNIVTNWKRGVNSISISTLNDMLIFLGINGVDITHEIKNNVQEIRHLNGRYIIYRR